MLKEERQALILNKLHASGKVVVSQLAVELNVSEDTIRRDLLDLDQKGQVKRVFGGALPLEQPVIRATGVVMAGIPDCYWLWNTPCRFVARYSRLAARYPLRNAGRGRQSCQVCPAGSGWGRL